MEPLQLLRSATVRGADVQLDGDMLVFPGGQRLSRKTSTAYAVARGQGRDKTYRLDSLWLCHRLRDMQMRAYFEECKKLDIERVQIVDRQPMLDYLTGKNDTFAGAEGTARAASDADRSASAKISSKQRDSRAATSAAASAVQPEAGGRLASSAALAEELVSEAAPSAGGDEEERSVRERSSRATVPAADRRRAPEADERERSNDLRLAMSLEIEQRQRDDTLKIPERSFKHVLDAVSAFVTRREAERKKEAAKMETTADPRGDRYRVDNKRFYREEMGTDFESLGIDPSGTFKKSSRATAAAPPAASAAAMNGRAAAAATSVPAAVTPIPKRPRLDGRRAVPIIIAPAGRDASSLVTLANLPVLLTERCFKPSRELASKAMPQSVVSVKRQSPRHGQMVEYQLLSNVHRLQDADWERVVAVVCQGAEWQFKGYPARLGSTPHQILSKLQGFYFHFSGDTPEGAVKWWRVRFLAVNRTKRHEDAKVCQEFWRTLDDYLKTHNSPLNW